MNNDISRDCYWKLKAQIYIYAQEIYEYKNIFAKSIAEKYWRLIIINFNGKN